MSDYEKDLTINEGRLDREWIEQPSRYMKYSELSAQWDSKAKRAKEKVEITKAELYKQIKEEASESGDKITDKGIEASILTHKKYKEAMEEYLEANEKSSIYYSAVKAFEHRKSALENLVKLHIGGYFSTPKEGGEVVAGEISKSAKDQYNEKRRKKSNE
jgi:hypothetical protein